MAEADQGKLTFQALLLANEQRNAYGLRYNDYGRYRKHCANRTHRLRSSLKLTHGKGREFKKLPPVKLENIKDGYLQLLLFEAERAWAYSRELSHLATLPANKEKVSSLKRNATSRFRRAVNWATQLLSHCQSLYASSRLSANSLIQATAYTLILNGRFLRYRFDFEDALVQLSVAKALLDELTAQAETSRDQALATSFADEIGPEIRHCSHELGNNKAYDVGAIAAETAGKHKNEIVEGYDALVKSLVRESIGGPTNDREKLKALIWEGEPVPVRNPELVDVLLKVQEEEEKLQSAPAEKAVEAAGEGKKGRVGKGQKSKRGVAAYDAILLALSEAEGVGRKLVEAQQLSGGNNTSPAGTRDLQFVHAYIVYQLLSCRIQRDLLLIATLLHESQSPGPQNTFSGSAGPSKTKPGKEQVDARVYPAVVKLLDTTIQSLTQMRTLTVVDDSPDLATAVDARTSFSKARRCRYLARSYIAVKRYAEALTLIQHATLHLREARSSLNLLPPDQDQPPELAFYPLTSEAVDGLNREITDESLQHRKDWFTYNGGDAVSAADRSTYKKPLFFDIALNYVELDMDKLQERAGKKVAVVPTPKIVAPAPQRAPSTQGTANTAPEAERKAAVNRAKVEEIQRPATPEPSTARGLTGLLGGWWGRK